MDLLFTIAGIRTYLANLDNNPQLEVLARRRLTQLVNAVGQLLKLMDFQLS